MINYYPMIKINDHECFNYVYAQHLYEDLVKNKSDQIKIEIYQTKVGKKPLHVFLLHKNKIEQKNLYLQLIMMINSEIERIKQIIYNEELDDIIKKRKEEELARLRKCEEEAEEWYIQFVIENERRKDNCDMWLISLLTDPNEYENYDYYSPSDIVYMAYNLALFDKENGRPFEDVERLFSENEGMDINSLVCRFESCFDIKMRNDFHQNKVEQYIKLFADNPYIKYKILKNNDVYKNIHKSKTLKRGIQN